MVNRTCDNRDLKCGAEATLPLGKANIYPATMLGYLHNRVNESESVRNVKEKRK